jgi:hypothetical protein
MKAGAFFTDQCLVPTFIFVIRNKIKGRIAPLDFIYLSLMTVAMMTLLFGTIE